MKQIPFYSILIFSLISLMGTSVSAQNNKINVRGSIKDIKSKKPLSSASLKIIKIEDSSILKDGHSNKNGEFNLTLRRGNNQALIISFLGYQNKIIPIVSSEDSTQIRLGNVYLKRTSNKLSEVTVKAEKKRYEYKNDSIIFNVPENFEPGGTAKDILLFTPSLTIDANNRIRIKGQTNVAVYVDNRPISELGYTAHDYLENTPSFMIERIEILKESPYSEDRAKDRAAGIINRYYLNIITRKIQYKGYTAEITTGGNTRREKSAGMHVNLNLKPFQLNYNNRLSRKTDSSYINRTSFLENGDSTLLHQKNHEKSLSFNQHLNGQYTFKFSENERLRLQTNLDWNSYQSDKQNYSSILNPKNIPDQKRIQSNHSNTDQYSINGEANYKKEFDKKGRYLELTFSLNQNYSGNKHHGIGDYLLKKDSLLQMNKGKNSHKNFHANIQYKNVFGSDSSHFYLLNGSFSHNNQHQLNRVSRSDTTLPGHQLFKNDQLSTDNFNQTMSYNGLFLIGKQDKKLGWLSGALISYNKRDYHEDFRGSLVKNNTFLILSGMGVNYSPQDGHELNLVFIPKFRKFNQTSRANGSAQFIYQRYLDFIPGASLKYATHHHEVSFQYDRKIKQPDWNQLDPYVNNQDPLNIKTGNPDLLPESGNTFKLTYEYSYQSFYTALHLKNQVSKDVISSYTFVDSNGISTRTFVNLKERKNYSADLNAGFHYYKTISDKTSSISANIDGGLSAYQTISNDEHVSREFHQVSGVSGNLKLRAAFKIKTFTFILKSRYEGPRYFSQGKTPGHFQSGFQTQIALFQHAFNVSIGMENIFGATVKDNFYKTDKYIQYSSNRKDVRYFSLHLTYSFKKYKKTKDH